MVLGIGGAGHGNRCEMPTKSGKWETGNVGNSGTPACEGGVLTCVRYKL